MFTRKMQKYVKQSHWLDPVEINQWHGLFYFMFHFLRCHDKPVCTRWKLSETDALPY